MFVITGGGSGIGRALALSLAAREHDVCIVGRRLDFLQEVASHSSRIQVVQADLSTDAGCKTLLQEFDSVPRIEGLINNAGIIDPIAPIASIAREDWRRLMSTNLDAPLFLTQLFKDKLVGGRVLNIGSGAAFIPIVGWAAYCVSKAALSMLTRCWQAECSDIAFASVMPGIIDTAMQAVIRDSHDMSPEKHTFFVELKRNNQLLTSSQVAQYLVTLLLDVDKETYCSKEWDIYETFAQFPAE